MDVIKIAMVAVFVPVFAIAIVGNSFLLAAVYQRKRLRSPVNIFLVNVAISDLLFALLSTFQVVEFMIGKWALGDVYCRIHGAIIEVCYTVSVLTLSVVALERYMSICRKVGKHTIKRCIILAGCLWGTSLIFCTPLFYGWTAKFNNATGTIRCGSTYWSNKSKLIFYGVHTVFVYLLPLVIMITTHGKMFKFLKLQIASLPKLGNANNVEVRTRKRSTAKSMIRNRKVIQILFTITILFFLLWTPFVLCRLIIYSNVKMPGIIWNLSQFLLIVSTAVNFFIYAFMSPDLRKAFHSFLPWNRRNNSDGDITSGYETQM